MAVIARTLYAGLWGGLASMAAGGSFKDGAFQAAMVHLFNNELDRVLTNESYKKLVLRVVSEAEAAPKSILSLSSADTRLIAKQMYYQALKGISEGTSYINAMARGADSFLRMKSLSSRIFEVNGARYYGGEINYIAVGAYNVAYGVPSFLAGSLTGHQALLWNLGQFFGVIERGSGMFARHNITSIPDNMMWGMYGSFSAH